MKNLALILALAATFAVLTPATSQAHEYYHSEYYGAGRRIAYYCRECGQPVFQERRFAGYGRHHSAIYVWRTIPHHHRHGRFHHRHFD